MKAAARILVVLGVLLLINAAVLLANDIASPMRALIGVVLLVGGLILIQMQKQARI